MDQPIACTLAPEEFRYRTGELAAFAAQALLTREPTVDGERLTFEGTLRRKRGSAT